MKKAISILAVLLCLLIAAWAISVLYAAVLTGLFSSEFTDFEALDYDFMHAWKGDEPPKIRVLSYSSKFATVYFCNSTGGEKTTFIRTDSGWKCYERQVMWSTGNADDYFVWPYFKDWMF